ncbi:MAG: LptF/LptG family permease [Planctomycetes bacterium]|nr:LptF/LptG family permease [Planctomycetota bacterium]
MILQRYVLRELLATFALSFAATVTLCAVGVIFQAFRAFEGMTVDYLVRLAPVALSAMSPWAMIIAACLTATLVYGRLAADNEIDAVRTSGIHVNLIFVPAILFGLLLCIFAYFIHAEAAPRARYARRLIVKETLLLVLRNPPSGRQPELKIGSRNRLSYADFTDGRLVRPALLILKEVPLKNGRKENRPEWLWFAREGHIKAPRDTEEGAPSITLADAAFVKFNPMSDPDQPAPVAGDGRYKQPHTVEFELDDIYRRSRGPLDMSTPELNQYRQQFSHDREQEKGGRCRRCEADTEYHSRFARSFAPLALVLLCMPIGVFVKKGSRLAGMGAGLPAILGYIVLMIVGEGLGTKGRLDPQMAAYGPTAVIALLAGVLLLKVYRK